MFAMRFRSGPGPVFAFESLAAARRWQMYALRSIYVGLLLAGLTLTWGPSDRSIHTLAEAAKIAGVFFRTLIGVQLAVVCWPRRRRPRAPFASTRRAGPYCMQWSPT
jgi:hypothetical protein